jgi:hypothetical protein
VPKLDLPSGPEVAYEPKGRRDPSAKLTGIVRRANGAALALVETADGLGYILKAGDTLGDGRLVEIGPNNVVFRVPERPGSLTNRVVLSLAGD